MSKVRKKEYQEQNVYEAALDRIRYMYSIFDNIEVNFSAGKDSTAVLNLTIKVAKELNRLPVTVRFFDEEAIHPPTIEYAERVSKRPEVNFKWYALEFKHRNACSNEEPYWYCWEKGKEHLWVRPMPKNAITEHPKFYKGLSFQAFADLLPNESDGTTVILTGVRTQESLRRYRSVAMKKNDNYITRGGHLSKAHPIYDWSSEDVWKLVEVENLDYNRTYDVFNKTKFYNKLLPQRVCPPYGEEPLRGLWIYAECFPEMWHKMLNRVDGVNTAYRYANTELYGVGKLTKPEDITYKEWITITIDSYDKNTQSKLKKFVSNIVKIHYQKTNQKIHETIPNVVTGLSWQTLHKVIVKGDLKGRTSEIRFMMDRSKRQKELGIKSFDEAVRRYATKEYQKKHFKL